MNRPVIVLWQEQDWRCECHPGVGGESRLEVYRGETLAAAEATPSGTPAEQRAAVLRQRVLRGDLNVEK